MLAKSHRQTRDTGMCPGFSLHQEKAKTYSDPLASYLMIIICVK